MKKILYKDIIHTELPCSENDISKNVLPEERESVIPYGSSVILKKYPDTGGIISYSIFHHKIKKQIYHIYINGKKKTKRYTKDDFILDLKGSWGHYPWFPEDGDHFINASDLENFKAIQPYGKIFQCIEDDGVNLVLKHKDMTFRVNKNLYKIINNPELIKEKYNFSSARKNSEINTDCFINKWGHYLGDKNIVLEDFLLKEPFKREVFLNDGGIFHCIGKEGDSVFLKYYTYIFKTKSEFFRIIPSFLSCGDLATLRNNPKIKGIITEMYWNYTSREYIYLLTINGKKKTQKFLAEDFISQ